LSNINGHYSQWDVEHVEGNRYLLTIGNFVTRSEGDSLWSYDHNVFQEVKGTKWIIERKDGANHYTYVSAAHITFGHVLMLRRVFSITDTEGKGWTLRGGNSMDIVTFPLLMLPCLLLNTFI